LSGWNAGDGRRRPRRLPLVPAGRGAVLALGEVAPRAGGAPAQGRGRLLPARAPGLPATRPRYPVALYSPP